MTATSDGKRIGSKLLPYQQSPKDPNSDGGIIGAGWFGAAGTFLSGVRSVGVNKLPGEPTSQATEIIVSALQSDQTGKLLRYELDAQGENQIVAVEQFDMADPVAASFEGARNIIWDGEGYNLIGDTGGADLYRIVPGHPELTIQLALPGGGDSYDAVFAFGFLWVTDGTLDTLYKVDMLSGSPAILNTLALSSSGGARGIDADIAGRRLWIATGDSTKGLIEVDPNLSGAPTEVSAFDVGPGTDLSDLVFGAGFIWALNPNAFVIKINPVGPTLIGFLVIGIGGDSEASLIFDDAGASDKLWVCASAGGTNIGKVDVAGFTLDTDFDLGSGMECRSLARLGNRIWCPDSGLTGGGDPAPGRVTRVDPVAESVVDRLGSVFLVWGAAGGARKAEFPQVLVIHDGGTDLAAQEDDLQPIDENGSFTGTEGIDVLFLQAPDTGAVLTGLIAPQGVIKRRLIILNSGSVGPIYLSNDDPASLSSARFQFDIAGLRKYILWPGEQVIFDAFRSSGGGWVLPTISNKQQLRLSDDVTAAAKTVLIGDRQRYAGGTIHTLTIANTGVSAPWPGAQIEFENVGNGTALVTITNGGSGVLIGNPYAAIPGTLVSSFTTSVPFARFKFEFDGTAWQLISSFPDLDFQTVISDTIAGDQNNYSPTGLAAAVALGRGLAILKIDGGAADRTITGIIAAARVGKRLFVFNEGTTNNLIFPDLDVLSLAANRISDPAGNVTLLPRGVMTLMYDTNWRVT